MKTRSGSEINDNKRKRPSDDGDSKGKDHSEPEPKANRSETNNNKSRQPSKDSGSEGNDRSEPEPKANRSETNNNNSRQPSKDSGSEGNDRSETEPKPKPRLTTPDLEFDYDRSQLRDPRPTPGRKARPRHCSHEIDSNESLKARLEAEFTIPKPEKPKGRLNAMIKNELFKQESLMNPAFAFHDIHRCDEKGRHGSPTYDDAGFQLDYDKVCDWQKPRPYNKGKMIRNMEKSVEASQSKEDRIASLFFRDGSNEKTKDMWVIMYVQDHVSKDIGIPFHQIDPAKVEEWREKGFEPVDYETWWKEPTEEEKKRMGNMTMGSVLRKDL